ncbi:MAG: M1 family metallopeptidase [Flavobacteriales bacterium]|nr:M1 family metallopeptidase [Flavobacteriales bacterium]
MMRLCLSMLLLSVAHGVHAQSFTSADSLRGMLTPMRTCFDVTHYELDIAIDPDQRSIAGSNTIHFTATADFDSLQIDLFDNLTIDSIVGQGRRLRFSRRHHAVSVTFPDGVKRQESTAFQIYYHGMPIAAKAAPWDGGFVWQKDANGKHHIGVACEGLGASVWWPTKDHLSDEPDSVKMHFTVPNGLMAVGNGQYVGRREQGPHTRWSWKVADPINNYNVTVNIGDYVHFSDWHVAGTDSLRLNYYVLRDNEQKAREHFKQVGPMLKIYEEAFGPYPFYADGYALIETSYAGMEHQSAIAYGNRYMKGYHGRFPSDMDFDYIIIHETGHEWWGNSVSMNDLADMWVHESFCTYAESVFVEAMYGYDRMVEYLLYQKHFITDRSPIVGVYGMNHKGNSTDMYYKGSWMLHTLRSVVNDDVRFKAMLKAIATEFRHSTVDGADIIAFVSTYLGSDLAPFFHQYLNHADLPVLEHRWAKGELQLKWNSPEKGFAMPMELSLGRDRAVRSAVHADRWVSIPVSKKELRHIQFWHHRFLFVDRKVGVE